MNTKTILLIIAGVIILAVFGKALIGTIVQLAVLVAWVFGVIRSFQAHWILGVVALLIAPVGVIVGAGSLILGRNLGDDIVGIFRR